MTKNILGKHHNILKEGSINILRASPIITEEVTNFLLKCVINFPIFKSNYSKETKCEFINRKYSKLKIKPRVVFSKKIPEKWQINVSQIIKVYQNNYTVLFDIYVQRNVIKDFKIMRRL